MDDGKNLYLGKLERSFDEVFFLGRQYSVWNTPASYAHATTHTLLKCTDGDVKGRSCRTEARTTAVYRLYGLCCTFCSLHA